RNKVAVPEGAAGTPPFWSESSCGSLPLVHFSQRVSLEGTFKARCLGTRHLILELNVLDFKFQSRIWNH
ncbi:MULTISPECIES: hypothetical protein, partial [Butyricimonas]|uniref:hypothetical protein n=1 Tax=Butyricimonas TaxID=574697 RepID=UPI001D0945BA